VPLIEGYQFINRTANVMSMMEKRSTRFLHLLGKLRHLAFSARKSLWHARKVLPSASKSAQEARIPVAREIQIKAIRHVIERLQNDMASSDTPTEIYSNLLVEYQSALSSLIPASPSVTAYANRENSVIEVVRSGLYIELDTVQDFYDDGKIPRTEAVKLRQNVMLMLVDLEEQV